ncbi:alpha/beta hydrolase family protein [Thalassotalea euphylliae]|uniref:Alpha/beta fold hydrolase n=1 Tax=Thalassotalea euphylliae TaxID=1655234 RepID=A0A3E0U1T7_9GAMM|nr:alpha/beta fold hydrolase [Thalassotalea euphylliae]REL30679.1 alpha/beta fold hydrolase [Thalassotalea euphylliae]
MQQRFSAEICCHNPLVGYHFQSSKADRGVVVIAAAMGVEQKFYFDFAQWLAEQGFEVLTFDYRGMGQSLRQPLAQVSITISDWVQQDCVYMIDKAELLAQGKPIYWLGHSLGGQVFAMIPNRHKVTQIITVASGSGYWKTSDIKIKSVSLMLWFLVVPIATRLVGYFPGKRLGIIGDLPYGVMRQWRQWCLNPDYLVGCEGNQVREQYHALTLPITALAFQDDELINYASVDKLHSFYQTAEKNHQYISPKEQNLEQIGHFGFFRSKHAQTLWPAFITPILECS